ncbi:MAG: PA2169 family four-helix-bundle protein [Xanthomonadales bacterium]|nr:PA2169 family four-helix-bundle protein [Xanthomonadales bacterium]
MNHHTDTSTLNDLIQVLNDGKSFYEEAAPKVRSDLASVFQRMARTKAAIVADLQSAVASAGEKPADGGSFAGTVRKWYAEMRTTLSADSDAQYVAQLEEFEDRILAEFRNAVEKSDDANVRAIAQRHLPAVSRDHDDMRALKQIQEAHAA